MDKSPLNTLPAEPRNKISSLALAHDNILQVGSGDTPDAPTVIIENYWYTKSCSPPNSHRCALG